MLPELSRTTLAHNQNNSLSENDDSSPLLDVLWADAMRDVIGRVVTKVKAENMSKDFRFYYKHGSTTVLCGFYPFKYHVNSMTNE